MARSRKFGIMLALAGGLLAGACSTTVEVGRPLDINQADEFTVGVTTYQDVVARFGEPQRQMTHNDGRRQAVWGHAIVERGHNRGTSVSILFDQSGRVTTIAKRFHNVDANVSKG